eukprot:scaffold49071_cov54-Attheya_sp.AAC.2
MDVVDPLSFVCHKDVAQGQGCIVCKKLQEVLPRQQFVTVIQAKAEEVKSLPVNGSVPTVRMF